MKKKGFYLFELIKNLEHQEKRYLSKKISSQAKESDSKLLYDFILEQEIYSDNEIKKQFGDKLFVNNLDEKKKYLYDLILRILQDYNYDSHEIENKFLKIQVLMSKKLYHHAYILNENILKKVTLLEEFESQIMVFKNRVVLSNYLFHLNKIEALEKIREISFKQQKYNSIDLVHQKLMLHLGKITFQRDASQKAIIDYFTEELVSLTIDPSQSDYSIKSHVLYLICFYYLHATCCEWEEAYYKAKEADQLVKQNAKLFEQLPLIELTSATIYFNTKIFYAKSGANLKTEFEIYSKYFEKYTDPHLSNLFRTRLIQYQLIIMDVSDQKIDAVRLEEVLNFLISNPYKIETFKLKFLYFDLGKLYYFKNEIRKCLKWLNKIEMPEVSVGNIDIYIYSKIICLICEIEKQETEFVKKSIAKLVSFLKKNNFYYEFEKYLLDFLKTIYIDYHGFDKAKKRKVLADFLDSYKKITSSEYNKCISLYFNFDRWVKKLLEEIK